MRVLVLGAQGMVGSYVVRFLENNHVSRPCEIVPVTRQDFECSHDTTFTDVDLFASKWLDGQDTWVINAVGLTNKMTGTEADFIRVNATYSQWWYQVCEQNNWRYIYISTNGVFSGTSDRPYPENAVPDATDKYGRSKVSGEVGMVVRVSVIGEDERNFRGLLEYAKKHYGCEVPGNTNEQWNGVTSVTLAKYLNTVIHRNETWDGPRHLTAPYSVTKAELLVAISDVWGLQLKIKPTLRDTSPHLLLSSNTAFGLSSASLRDDLKELKDFSVCNRINMFRKVLLIGGSGSLGRALIHRWQFRVTEFVVFSRGEHKQWQLEQEFPNVKFHFELGDVKDRAKMVFVLNRHQPDTLIYAAAMKHVDRCETATRQCLHSNCLGFLNVVEAAETLSSQRVNFPLNHVLYVSTDKACAPINIYGMSKSIGEHIVQNYAPLLSRIKLVGVRYGNVVNSNGSIIPVLRGQAQDPNRASFTLTDELMTRFYMTLDQSVQLIEDTLVYGRNGDLWIPQLKSMRIADLFSIFSQRYKKPVQVTGVRHGEKIHESLLSEHELVRATKHVVDNRVRFVVNNTTHNSDTTHWCYISSDNLISQSELERNLNAVKVL